MTISAVPSERAAHWGALAAQLRVDAVRATSAAGSGHPTSSLSAADLIAVLGDAHLRYDVSRPDRAENDRLIFSKGHASPLLYAWLKAAGAISDEELLSFRRHGSLLEGHPSPRLPWVDVATGSLGQGLPIAVGLGLCGKRLDRLGYRVWCLCGDGEMAEGSMWEAIEHAGFSGLDNLTLIVDVNRLGQSGETRYGWDTEAYTDRLAAFGWATRAIDGHDVAQIDAALHWAQEEREGPAAIVARTHKGFGIAAVDDAEGAHGKPLGDAEGAVAELGGIRDVTVSPRPPEPAAAYEFAVKEGPRTRYEPGAEVATRAAYGTALAELGDRRPDVVALDAEVSNSTFTDRFAGAHPERYFEMYIAEQQMVAAAVGMQVRGWTVFASTFAAFLSRAYDFVRMAAVSRANIRLVGSHAGCAIGEDGPSQMALEDLAAMRAVHSSTVLYPCDPNQTADLVERMADLDGVSYLRTTRNALPALYGRDEEFPIGSSRVALGGDAADDVTIAAAGITVHEAIKAGAALEREGIRARVLDLYSVKPIDAAAVAVAGQQTGGIVCVEDHWAEGGLGDAVLSALAEMDVRCRVRKLAVRDMPMSGTPEELLGAAGIDAASIQSAARELAA